MNETETKTVIVGTDGSPAADTAVDCAAAEAARCGRSLRIVHVQELWVYATPAVPTVEYEQARAAESQRILDDARKRALADHPDLVVSTENVRGDLIKGLRDLAPHRTELVLGKRGRGTFADLLLGSTSLRLAGHTDGPVIVVRGENAPTRGEVVVGVSFDHDPRAALAYAFAAARVRGAVLRAVHVWAHSDTFVETSENLRGFAGPVDRLAELMTPWRTANDDVKVVEEIAVDQPVAALTEASARADLLVVGSHRRGRLGALLGSVGHGVLHHAHCPVAVVPSR